MTEPKNQLDFDFRADDLLEFPRDLGEQGWFQFHSEKKLAYARVEEKFGVPLNRRVRLRLRGGKEEIVGRLTLDSLLLPPPHAETIGLRLCRVSFENTDIEYCQVIDD